MLGAEERAVNETCFQRWDLWKEVLPARFRIPEDRALLCRGRVGPLLRRPCPRCLARERTVLSPLPDDPALITLNPDRWAKNRLADVKAAKVYRRT